MTRQDKPFRELERVSYVEDVVDELRHGVASVGRVALPVPAQVGCDHSIVTREVIELMLPGLRYSRVPVYEHYGAFDTLGPQVDNAQV